MCWGRPYTGIINDILDHIDEGKERSPQRLGAHYLNRSVDEARQIVEEFHK